MAGLLGETIDAAESLRIGLANRLVDEGDVLAVAVDLAARIAAQPPLAIRGARRAIEASWYSNPDDGFAMALDEQLRCLRSADFLEGVAAFVEGRTPRWQCR